MFNNIFKSNMASKALKITDVTPPTEFPESFKMEDYLTELRFVRESKGKVLHHTSPQNPVYASFSNGFAGSLFDAYSNHYALSVKPDDVWLAIVLTFANYVDKHAEEMRQTFVDHEGKKDLTVKLDTNVSWDAVMAQFSDLIDQNTKSEVRSWLEPNFSTTTSKDRLIG